MALLYDFGDVVSTNVAQVEVVVVALASPGPGTIFQVAIDALDGRGPIGFRYVTTGNEPPSQIAAALVNVLARDQTVFGVSLFRSALVLLGPLGKPFVVTVTPTLMTNHTSQPAVQGIVAENMRVVVSREIFTIPKGTGLLHPGLDGLTSKTVVSARGVDTGTRYELTSDDILTLVATRDSLP